VERSIATATTLIRKMLSEAGADWVPVLPIVQLMMNTKCRDLTLLDPFRMMFARAANQFANFVSVPLVADKAAALERWMLAQRAYIHELIPGRRDRIEYHQVDQNARFNSRHAAAPEDVLSPGTVVMLKDPVRASKNEPPYVGVYTIDSRDEARKGYKLRDAVGKMYPSVVTIDRLKVLPKAVVPTDVAYIEKLLDDAVIEGIQHFYVKFVDDAQPVWIPSFDILDAAAINSYWSKKRSSSSSKQSSSSFTSK
jgi:hypothetical protein